MRGSLQAPPLLGVLALLLLFGVLVSREASTAEGLPVFLPSAEKKVHVELSGAGITSGIYQLNDGFGLRGVIGLTCDDISAVRSADGQPFLSGERLRLEKKERKIAIVRSGWMRASHRMALGILLHPDRMTEEDWLCLPGIGAVLSARIEQDRQIYGDFGSLEALTRVKGIGKKSVEKWRRFFLDG